MHKTLISTTGLVGLNRNDDRIVDTAFDILSLEALFLVPRRVASIDVEVQWLMWLFRICSLLSLNPYFGALVCSAAYLDLHLLTCR